MTTVVEFWDLGGGEADFYLCRAMTSSKGLKNREKIQISNDNDIFREKNGWNSQSPPIFLSRYPSFIRFSLFRLSFFLILYFSSFFATYVFLFSSLCVLSLSPISIYSIFYVCLVLCVFGLWVCVLISGCVCICDDVCMVRVSSVGLCIIESWRCVSVVCLL